MRVLYHINSLETVYAARFIYEGYRSAWLDGGHEFRPYTSKDNLQEILESFQPDIFMTGLVRYNLKFLDLELLRKYRDRGMVMLTNIPTWHPLNNVYGSGGLKNDPEFIELIKSGLAGDIFFHFVEQDSSYMDGYEKGTGTKFHTILLAADKNRFYYEYDDKYKSDISFVGSFLPDKREFMRKHLLPLRKRYDVKIYGSDWNYHDRILGYVQKAGQYLNIDALKSVRKLHLPLDDERKVYSSSTISLNVHMSHCRKYGFDFNERVFKIIASGGFEICDNVKVLRRYLNEDELVIGENTKDWFEKIDYYIKNPEKRLSIIQTGQKKVLADHTYHNRVSQIEKIYKDFKKVGS